MTVNQEYAGGLVAEFEVDLPAVLGVQTSREAPRYAPVSRVRQLMKTATIEALEAPAAARRADSIVEAMAVPEAGRSRRDDRRRRGGRRRPGSPRSSPSAGSCKTGAAS